MSVPAPTLFQQALGAAFFRLPESLRRLHGTRGLARYAGVVTVEGGGNALARLCARIAGLPKPMQDAPLAVEFACDARSETWKRDFNGIAMTSRLALKDGLLRERLGPLHFRHALHANEGAIWWTVAGVRLFGLVPLPASLFDGVRCQERELQGRYTFLVEASLPLVGQVVRYAGWLEPAVDGQG